ncbi:hypothetical protein E2C01_051019 [Portunus trituberculatus]|uniref:Uncharacterized protein n=1 Tax=Portunus trituberculatus TaxID=210409 RepID=A0A5B7GIF3_PORTR|nr:hypothetical protein [Portunus trituberculatus]
MLCAWRGRSWNVLEQGEMEGKYNPFMYPNSSLEHFSNYNDPDSTEPTDTRPSILITFQNSASYYTSYMGSGGTRGGGGHRRQNFDSPPEQLKQLKEHPIVIMNDYPSPAPVSVAVSTRKLNTEPSFQPFSGPPAPQGPPKPPGPPGPPVPNLPPSRRESLSTATLELPKRRRSSASPSIASRSSASPSVASRNRSPSTHSTQSRTLIPNNLPSTNEPPRRPHGSTRRFESSTLPRKMSARPPRNSQSMPILCGDVENENLEPPTPSPRPSVCSSAITNSQQGERRPLMSEHRSSSEMEDWTPPSQPKPNWLSLNLDNNDRKECRAQSSVYVAEIWPSLVCILTAVLMTLIVYILVSYFYYVPHPTTRNRIAPSLARPTPYPDPYPYPYPPPPPYDHYPPYQYPPPHVPSQP